MTTTNPLEQLAGTRSVIMIDAATLLEYLHTDREETYMEGIREGRRLAQAAALSSVNEPLTKKQAAKALGFSEGTIDNMRRRGELESYEYGGQVRIERAEVERWKRTHTGIYLKSKCLTSKK